MELEVRENHAMMSSKDIADVTGKQLKHVHRDIRNMLKSLDDPDLDHVREIKDPRGYTVEFRLGRLLTMNLITGYDAALRMKVIKRLDELESGTVLNEGAVALISSIVVQAVKEVVPQLVQAQLAQPRQQVRRAVSAGEVWNRYGFPKLKGAAAWLGNRLKEMGCQVDGYAKGDLGVSTARMFDSDKADVMMKNGLRGQTERYVQERQGQGKLRLIES